MPNVYSTNTLKECEVRQWITQYGDDIIKMCYLYIGDRQYAEDAAQETFIKAVRRYGAFRHECSEKTWLIRIAINTCKDFRRSKWFRWIDNKMTVDEVQPSSYYQIDHSDDTIIKSVMELPELYKDVILLRYYQELSIVEIAQALRIPMGTVSTRLSTAKRMLYPKLKEWYFDE